MSGSPAMFLSIQIVVRHPSLHRSSAYDHAREGSRSPKPFHCLAPPSAAAVRHTRPAVACPSLRENPFSGEQQKETTPPACHTRPRWSPLTSSPPTGRLRCCVFCFFFFQPHGRPPPCRSVSCSCFFSFCILVWGRAGGVARSWKKKKKATRKRTSSPELFPRLVKRDRVEGKDDRDSRNKKRCPPACLLRPIDSYFSKPFFFFPFARVYQRPTASSSPPPPLRRPHFARGR